jgi:hypothetical protein
MLSISEVKKDDRIIYRLGFGNLEEGIVEDLSTSKQFIKIDGKWQDTRGFIIEEVLNREPLNELPF